VSLKWETQRLKKGGLKVSDWQTPSCYSPGMGHRAAIAVIRLVSFTTALLMRREGKCSCESLLSSCQRRQQPLSVA